MTLRATPQLSQQPPPSSCPPGRALTSGVSSGANSARLNRKMMARTGGAAAVDGGNVLQTL
tara:strand:+ start:575 stop:757 length:183 start_codon:yes stop_codon:yes gene_type:complete